MLSLFVCIISLTLALTCTILQALHTGLFIRGMVLALKLLTEAPTCLSTQGMFNS